MTTSTTPTRSRTHSAMTLPAHRGKGEQAVDRRATKRSKRSSLDNLTTSRKEGFRAAAEAPTRVQPERLSMAQLNNLSDPARTEYNRRRGVWHVNVPTIRTAQLIELQQDLDTIVASNQQDGDKVKGAIAVEGPAGIGKSIAVLDFAKQYHRELIAELGEFTDDGNERWPVCRVGMTGDTGIKDFMRAMLAFFAHAGTKRGTAAEFADRALDCVLSCETRLLIVDFTDRD
jgi:AAA domain